MAHNEEIFAVYSQIELLNTINEHTKTGSRFIGVEGHVGSGKSWISQHYLMIDEENLAQALLIGSEVQTAEQQRDIIIGQLLPKCIIEDDTIIDCLIAYREDKIFNATIIIDNAEYLQSELLEELSQVVLNAKGRKNWRINVVLFAQSNQLETILADVEIKPELQLLNVKPFNEDEKSQFAEAIIVPGILDESNVEKLRNALPEAPPYPYDLLKLGEHYRKAPFSWVRPFLIAVLIIVIMLGWVTSWYNNYSTESDGQEPVATQQEDANSSTTESTSDNATSEKPVPENAASENTASENTTGKSKTEVELKPNMELTEATAMPLEKVLSQWDNRRLMGISDRRYTLQIGAFGNSYNAMKFITEHKLKNARIHNSQRKGKLLFLVTYKDFASVKEAQAATKELPVAIQKQNPWAKSLRSVHHDIKQLAN